MLDDDVTRNSLTMTPTQLFPRFQGHRDYFIIFRGNVQPEPSVSDNATSDTNRTRLPNPQLPLPSKRRNPGILNLNHIAHRHRVNLVIPQAQLNLPSFIRNQRISNTSMITKPRNHKRRLRNLQNLTLQIHLLHAHPQVFNQEELRPTILPEMMPTKRIQVLNILNRVTLPQQKLVKNRKLRHHLRTRRNQQNHSILLPQTTLNRQTTTRRPPILPSRNQRIKKHVSINIILSRQKRQVLSRRRLIPQHYPTLPARAISIAASLTSQTSTDAS